MWIVLEESGWKKKKQCLRTSGSADAIPQDRLYENATIDCIFHIIQCRVLNSSGVEISDTVKLNEAASTYTGISIYDGHLSESPATFQFRGNTASEAYAVVSYQGYWNVFVYYITF